MSLSVPRGAGLLLLAFSLSPARAAELYVGAGATCPYKTIQAAVDAVATPVDGRDWTTIHLVADRRYASQRVQITGRNVALVGARACPGTVPAPDAPARTLVSGDGQFAVFRADNSRVRFQDLEIAGGGTGVMLAGAPLAVLQDVWVHDNVLNGGVLMFGGSGVLELRGVELSDNHSEGNGGGLGIDAQNPGTRIDVTIVDDPARTTSIHHNMARDGGAIALAGDVRLRAVASAPGRIVLRDNQAKLRGGALFVTGAGVADLALPGEGLLRNAAEEPLNYGQGSAVHVEGSGAIPALVRIFTTDTAFPTVISGSERAYSTLSASAPGGNASGARARLCLWDTALRLNTVGHVVFAGEGGEIFFNHTGPECDPAAVQALGAVACDPAHAACNRFEGNTGAFALFGASTGGRITARGLRIIDNSFFQALDAAATTSIELPNTLIDLADSLIAYNRGRALVQNRGAIVRLDSCTVASNAIELLASNSLATYGPENRFNPTTIFQRSILDLRPALVTETEGPQSQANYVLAFPVPSPALLGAENVSFDPRFLAPEDLRLGPDSPALDFAPGTSIDPLFDLDARPREVDLPERINRQGARDLGAFERQRDDPLTGSLFANGFELQ